MNKKLTLLLLFFATLGFAQYGNRDGNRIGISAGISQTTLFTNNFKASPGMGFAGGLSVRGNYYNNWSMIYGMQFFSNNFSLESSFNQDIKYNIQGVQVRILFSYNVVEDHVSLDFGPVLQVNSKLKFNDSDENNFIVGNELLRVQDIEDINPINFNVYAGISGGFENIRLSLSYQYGVTNILNNLNKQEEVTALADGKLKGNLGVIAGNIIFYF